MDVAAKNAFFKGGTDAFIEDWLETGKNLRTTNLRGGWKRKLNGEWYPFKAGRYSVNYWDLEPGKRSFNFKTNWDGGVSKDETGEFYFMTAGGKATKPSVKNPSRHSIKRNQTKPAYESLRLAKAEARLAKRKLTVNWVVNEQTLPPFEHRLKIMNKAGKVLATFSAVKPHGRSAVINLPRAWMMARSRRNWFASISSETKRKRWCSKLGADRLRRRALLEHEFQATHDSSFFFECRFKCYITGRRIALGLSTNQATEGTFGGGQQN